MEALNYIANDSVLPTTWRTLVGSILHYSTLPIVKFVRVAIFIVHTIFLPLIYLCSFFYRMTVYPFSLLWRLETIYIYLFIAAFIGILTGCILYFFSSLLTDLLSLNRPAPSLFDQFTTSLFGGRRLENWSENTLFISGKTRNEEESIPWYSGSEARKMEALRRPRGFNKLRHQPILEEDSEDSHF